MMTTLQGPGAALPQARTWKAYLVPLVNPLIASFVLPLIFGASVQPVAPVRSVVYWTADHLAPTKDDAAGSAIDLCGQLRRRIRDRRQRRFFWLKASHYYWRRICNKQHRCRARRKIEKLIDASEIALAQVHIEAKILAQSHIHLESITKTLESLANHLE
jgi:hypothetical protein